MTMVPQTIQPLMADPVGSQLLSVSNTTSHITLHMTITYICSDCSEVFTLENVRRKIHLRVFYYNRKTEFVS